MEATAGANVTGQQRPVERQNDRADRTTNLAGNFVDASAMSASQSTKNL
jgi:hypothetical protein